MPRVIVQVQCTSLSANVENMPVRNAFAVMMNGSARSEKLQLTGYSNPTNSSQKLFNACCSLIHKLGERFPKSMVQSGGSVHSVAKVISKTIWELDNQMPRFVDLAGGKLCVPAFVYCIQPNCDGGTYDGVSEQKLCDDWVERIAL